MRIAVAAVTVLLLAAPAARADDTYRPKDKKFSVTFPGAPKESSQTAKTALGDLKVVTATYATADGNVFMVSYTDFPAGTIKPETHASLYDGVKEGLVGKDGKLVAEKDVKVGRDGLPGKEFVIDKGKLQARYRVVIKDNRLVQIANLGPGEFVTGKDATAFLDSFEFTK